MCLFPSVARIFSISTARFRPGVRTKIVFFHSLLKNRVLARGVFQKLSPKHFNRVFHYFLLVKMCLFPSLRLIFSIFWHTSRARVWFSLILGLGRARANFLYFFRILQILRFWRGSGSWILRFSVKICRNPMICCVWRWIQSYFIIICLEFQANSNEWSLIFKRIWHRFRGAGNC